MEKFSKWAQEQGYELHEGQTNAKGKTCVRFIHEGTLILEQITSHTIAIRRKADELGGDYDGWEVPVCIGD